MLLVHFKISRGEKYIKYPTNKNIFTKIVLQPAVHHTKQNKQILSWTHWLCLMIFSSKVDLCCGHKDSLYPLSRRGKEDISRLFQDVCSCRTQWFFDLNVAKLLTVIATFYPLCQLEAVDFWPKHLNWDKIWVAEGWNFAQFK